MGISNIFWVLEKELGTDMRIVKKKKKDIVNIYWEKDETNKKTTFCKECEIVG